jgi:hypothetical protein
MTPPYTVVPQIVDKPAPGANTDLLDEDFTLPHEGFQDVQINIALQVAGKVNLIMKPGPTLLGQKASGSFTSGTGANMVAGKIVTIDDGVNDPVVFEYVEDAEDIADPANIPVVFDGTETAVEMAALLLAAIAVAIADEALDMTAELDEDLATKINLENLVPGSFGNVAITDDIAHASYVPAGMSGGYGGDVVATLDLNGAANLAVEALYQKTFRLQSGYAYNLQLTVDGIIRALSVTANQ